MNSALIFLLKDSIENMNFVAHLLILWLLAVSVPAMSRNYGINIFFFLLYEFYVSTCIF